MVKALDEEDEDTANEIIDLAIDFGIELDNMEAKRAKGFLPSLTKGKPMKRPGKINKKEGKIESKKKGIFGSLFGGKKKVAKSSRKEKDEIKQKGFEHKEAHESELRIIREELAKREVELEGLKGAYAKMSAEMASMRKRMEEKEMGDVRDLNMQVSELKKSLEVIHKTMREEFNASKTAYKDFGIELLHVAVKLAELEELIERGDTITEVDILDLNNSVVELERKLALIEAQEKHHRIVFVEQMQKEQLKMLKKLESKADTKKIVNAIKQYTSELRHEINERDAKIAAEMHIELKSSYYTLSEKVRKIDVDLEKAKSKKDLMAIHKKVAALSKNINKIKESELAIEQELEQQHLSDEALLQKIEMMSGRLQKTGEMSGLARKDIYKSIEALEMELKNRPGTKEVKSMMGSLNYMKGKLSKIEDNVLVCNVCGKKCKNARGLMLHKKMSHRKVAKKKKVAAKAKKTVVKKKKAVKKGAKKAKKKIVKKAKKKTAKPEKKKPKRLFGIIGG